jgi:hypothetical protein
MDSFKHDPTPKCCTLFLFPRFKLLFQPIILSWLKCLEISRTVRIIYELIMLTLFTPCLFNLASVHIHTIENLLQKLTSNFFPSKQKFKFDNYTSRGTKLLICLYLHMYYFIVQARHLELIIRTDRIYSHNLNINLTFFLAHICHIFKFQRTYKRFLCILVV